MTPQNNAYIAITTSGFVDGACFTQSPDTSAWIAEMRQAGMMVVELPRAKAKELLFAQLQVQPDQSSTGAHQRPGNMIVARRPDGTVEAAGWDYPEVRRDARDDWLERGLTLEFVTADQVNILAAIFPEHVFSTTAPVGHVLTRDQANKVLAGF